MPRKPDMPCAVCGQLMWRGRGVLPAGQAICTPCRRATYLERHNPGIKGYGRGCRCEGCRAAKSAANARKRGSSYDRRKVCVICGADFVTGLHMAMACSRGCAVEVKRRKRQRQRAIKRGAFVEHVDRLAVHERDGWRCYMCGCRLSRSAAVPDPRAATLDHLVPLARGGLHEAANVRSACFGCNCRKGDRGGNEQLLLIG